MTDTSEILARLRGAYGLDTGRVWPEWSYTRTHVAPLPGPARRKPTDSAKPVNGATCGDRGSVLAGTRAGYGSHPAQRIARPGANRDARYRPRAADFAGNATPATARVSAPDLTRTAAGRKIAGPPTVARMQEDGTTRTVPSRYTLQARADSENAARETWARERYNLMVAAGDAQGPRSPWGDGDNDAYPSGFTAKGNMGTQAARYGAPRRRAGR